jgi:predicted ArsR family transcriptional regulator
LEFEQRVKELAKIRDKEGYMAEAKKLPSGKYALFEHNCPLIQVARKYYEACIRNERCSRNY